MLLLIEMMVFLGAGIFLLLGNCKGRSGGVLLLHCRVNDGISAGSLLAVRGTDGVSLRIDVGWGTDTNLLVNHTDCAATP